MRLQLNILKLKIPYFLNISNSNVKIKCSTTLGYKLDPNVSVSYTKNI